MDRHPWPTPSFWARPQLCPPLPGYHACVEGGGSVLHREPSESHSGALEHSGPGKGWGGGRVEALRIAEPKAPGDSGNGDSGQAQDPEGWGAESGEAGR